MEATMAQHERSTRTLWLAAALLFVMPAVASAQGIGLRGGANVNPDQYYVGAKYESPLMDRIWFEPSVDAGFGNDAKLIAANLEATYRRPLSKRGPWTLVGGGGPALNHYRLPGYTQTQFGFNVVGGLRHAHGLFTEFKVGFADSPRFRFGVGYMIRPTRRGSPPRR
jgi:hypothetical protein